MMKSSWKAKTQWASTTGKRLSYIALLVISTSTPLCPSSLAMLAAASALFTATELQPNRRALIQGLQKSPNHQNGTVHITTHRLFYIDSARARSRSFSLDLALVARTDYYAGLFTSSPKVTLHLSPASSPTAPAPNDDPAGDSWVCEVCNYRNPPGASPATAKCTLCGVPRSKSSTSTLAS
ncbi:hypothetical protein EVG20_g11322, partial [Dentipellis fragilis]